MAPAKRAMPSSAGGDPRRAVRSELHGPGNPRRGCAGRASHAGHQAGEPPRVAQSGLRTLPSPALHGAEVSGGPRSTSGAFALSTCTHERLHGLTRPRGQRRRSALPPAALSTCTHQSPDCLPRPTQTPLPPALSTLSHHRRRLSGHAYRCSEQRDTKGQADRRGATISARPSGRAIGHDPHRARSVSAGPRRLEQPRAHECLLGAHEGAGCGGQRTTRPRRTMRWGARTTARFRRGSSG